MSPTWHTMSASQLVDAVHHRRRPAAAVDRPVVGVGDHRDAQAVQPAAEPGDRDVDAPDTRDSHRFGVAPRRAARRRRRRPPRPRHGTAPGPRRRARAAPAAAPAPTPTTRTTPRRHPAARRPVAAAQSRCERPCPRIITTGSATNAAGEQRPTRPTTTAAGHRVPADSSVHHGTPNSERHHREHDGQAQPLAPRCECARRVPPGRSGSLTLRDGLDLCASSGTSTRLPACGDSAEDLRRHRRRLRDAVARHRGDRLSW